MAETEAAAAGEAAAADATAIVAEPPRAATNLSARFQRFSTGAVGGVCTTLTRRVELSDSLDETPFSAGEKLW